MHNKKIFRIVIEGNIACGKSTLIKYLERYPKIEAFPEQVAEWCNIDGHNGLELLYSEPQRWSFTFNMLALRSRLSLFRQSSRSAVSEAQRVHVFERSALSTRLVFAERSAHVGHMNPFEMGVMDRFFDDSIEETCNFDLLIYLRCGPENCLQRIRARARPEERSIQLAFLQDLDSLYENWLGENGSRRFVNCPLVVFDSSRDLTDMEQLYDRNRRLFFCDQSFQMEDKLS